MLAFSNLARTVYKNKKAIHIMEALMSNRKEKNDMILEPLQVMVELSLLSFSPTGTKISVSNNILQLQPPTFYQGVQRWYSGDTKDDLYYLFHVMRRYYKWYLTKDSQMFKFILRLAKKGMDKLIETYNRTERTSIIHTLALYKKMLEFDADTIFKEDGESGMITIDGVFQQITDLYSPKLLCVICSVLQLIEKEENPVYQQQYHVALQQLLAPTNTKIRKWIREKLTC